MRNTAKEEKSMSTKTASDDTVMENPPILTVAQWQNLHVVLNNHTRRNLALMGLKHTADNIEMSLAEIGQLPDLKQPQPPKPG